MAVDDVLKAVLVCPKCRGGLSHRQTPEALLCSQCQLAYPVQEDIPVLLIDEALPLDDPSSITPDTP